MPLKFKGAWRFKAPPDGQFSNEAIPDPAVQEVIELIQKVTTQGDQQEVLEHFKGYFCRGTGSPHTWSSNASWAETDLWSYAQDAAKNAPLFIEAFYDACQSFAQNDRDAFAPDVAMINELLSRHGIGYEIRPPRLEMREHVTQAIPVDEPPPTLAEQVAEVLQRSLSRSEELLAEAHGREAVQELLWLLETVTTAFRGLDTGTTTVEGKYFNQIVRELQKGADGTTLQRVLNWVTALHGYLSSPTGGGVRHGLDLNEGVAITDNQARLFCNLVRSYLSFLLIEHERLARNG